MKLSELKALTEAANKNRPSKNETEWYIFELYPSRVLKLISALEEAKDAIDAIMYMKSGYGNALFDWSLKYKELFE